MSSVKVTHFSVPAIHPNVLPRDSPLLHSSHYFDLCCSQRSDTWKMSPVRKQVRTWAMLLSDYSNKDLCSLCAKRMNPLNVSAKKYKPVTCSSQHNCLEKSILGSLQCRSIKSKGLQCVLSWWAEGRLETDGVNVIPKAKLTSPRRSQAKWIFIKTSTIRENLICQFNYEASTQEGFGLDSVSLGESPSIPDSYNETER